MSQTFNHSFSASSGNSSQVKSFDEYQTTRRQKMELVTSDLQAKKDQDILDLQDTLRDLMMQLGVAHSSLISDERDFLQKKETLSTQLKKIKINADVQFTNARINHVTQMQRLEDELENSLQEYLNTIPTLMEPSKPVDIGGSRSISSPFKSPSGKRKISRDSVIDITDDEDDQLYIDRIANLENQKRELTSLIKEDERANQGRITEITTMMDVQDAQFEQEIRKLQEKMKSKEDQYQQQLNNLYADLQKAKDKRKATAQKREEKVSALQQQIDRVENEYKEKIREANQKAEKLKASLANINIRKSQQLELDRKRAEEQKQLNEESLSLQQQMYSMQRELQTAREESQLRRRELSAQIGPRRTASLFS